MFPHPTPAGGDIPLVDNSFAPEIFASGFSGLSIMNGVVSLTFESARCDHTKDHAPLERFVVGRVVAPVAAVQALVLGLHQLLGQHGLDPMTGVRQETCQ